ncbi:MAG TPA: hypothetical protein ENK06_03675 [Gammaproteobacteria bacterium]|nr:hypothetical protein [Gammaproteobacteria bacterium]
MILREIFFNRPYARVWRSIRKRARGIRDTEYFKLKIGQTSIPDEKSMFCFWIKLHSSKRRRTTLYYLDSKAACKRNR